MKAKLFSLFLSVLILVVAATMARAQWADPNADVKLTSLQRAQLGAGLNYEHFSSEDDASEPPFSKEFTLGLYGSWNIVPEVDLAGFIKHGFDNEYNNGALGVRYWIDTDNNPNPMWQIGAGLNYEWLWGEFEPEFKKQWTVGLYGAKVLMPKLTLAGFGKYGLDNRDLNLALGLRVPFYQGGS